MIEDKGTTGPFLFSPTNQNGSSSETSSHLHSSEGDSIQAEGGRAIIQGAPTGKGQSESNVISDVSNGVDAKQSKILPETKSQQDGKLDLTAALRIRDIDAEMELARGINPELDSERVGADR